MEATMDINNKVIRKPSVAGSFYNDHKELLLRQITDCFEHRIGPKELPQKEYHKERKIMAVISPHAGYMYSGPIAAHHFLCLSQEKTPDTIILLGPNHRGVGGEVAIMSSGSWETPLGSIEIDKEVASEMISQDTKKLIKDDLKAHLLEHSIEVQLPFLQFIYAPDQFKILPIVMIYQSLNTMKYLSEIIYKIVSHKSCLLIASSDFTHYEEQGSAKNKDTEAIEKILDMDSEKFYNTIRQNGASICGPGPIAVIMETSKHLGVKKGQLLKYATSGDVTGMFDQVVGYASIIFSL